MSKPIRIHGEGAVLISGNTIEIGDAVTMDKERNTLYFVNTNTWTAAQITAKQEYCIEYKTNIKYMLLRNITFNDKEANHAMINFISALEYPSCCFENLIGISEALVFSRIAKKIVINNIEYIKPTSRAEKPGNVNSSDSANPAPFPQTHGAAPSADAQMLAKVRSPLSSSEPATPAEAATRMTGYGVAIMSAAVMGFGFAGLFNNSLAIDILNKLSISPAPALMVGFAVLVMASVFLYKSGSHDKSLPIPEADNPSSKRSSQEVAEGNRDLANTCTHTSSPSAKDASQPRAGN